MKQRRFPMKLKASAGFTIVELMIATAVFSVVILLLTFGIIQITRSYYKGIVESNTQNTARDVMNTVAQTIQFSSHNSAAPTVVQTYTNTNGAKTNWFCVGNQQFSFALGYQLDESGAAGTDQTPQALILTPNVATCPPPGSIIDMLGANGNTPPTGRELLNTHMRLSKLTVTQQSTPNFYSVDVRVVYGDSDLLVSPGNLGTPPDTQTDASCMGQAGSQFCAVSELNSVVQQRQL